MIRKVAFTMLTMSDVDRARKFYKEALGLRPGLQGNQGDQWWIEYDLPEGGCIALQNFDASQPGGNALALEVENLDALIAHLKAHGVTFKSDIIHGPRCRMAMCNDTEGNALVLHQLNDA